jgi:hypothetical protein
MPKLLPLNVLPSAVLFSSARENEGILLPLSSPVSYPQELDFVPRCLWLWMRIVASVLLVLSSAFASGEQRVHSRLDLSLPQRLDAPQPVASASIRLTDFVGFIGNTFKVPLLVETTSPVPDLTIPAGTFSARQLLDLAVRQLPGYKWEVENDVAHLYRTALVGWRGNLLNTRIHRFYFPKDMGDFVLQFPNCIHSTIQGYDCLGGAITGIVPPGLDKEPLPYLESLKDVTARTILLRALQANGHFYVLIAYESTRPKLTSIFPFLNWFTQSLVPAEPAPMWVQTPKHHLR